MLRSRSWVVAVILLTIFLLFAGLVYRSYLTKENNHRFNGERALQDIAYQVSLGPRTPGSVAHGNVIAWIQNELEKAGWESELQNHLMMGHEITNIIAYRRKTSPIIILGAHYDSRLLADMDPDPVLRTMPVPGANDGASGVAVLLELARALPKESASIHLVFFDAEDNGNIPGWDWILGSSAFVETLTHKPDAVIILDMIGDIDLEIYIEGNSDAQIVNHIWSEAHALGYGDIFIEERRYNIIDDHIPFIQAGIPAVDIIDFDYPYWHTTHDTVDKVSAESLQTVGDVLMAWIRNFP